MKQTTLLAQGLGFPEGPRWHAGQLWFSDFRTRKISTIDLHGTLRTIIEVPGTPSGLGWLPDNTLLVVSMTDRRLLKLKEEQLTVFADLSQLASYHCNDMVVDSKGNAYIGNFGAPIGTPTAKLAQIILVKPNGEKRVVAEEMAFPNGCVITPDEKTFIVGETYAARLTAFDIEADGSLSNRRIWAVFDDLGIVTDRSKLVHRILPDGICLDAEGAIWVASPGRSAEVLRVFEGGRIADRIKVETFPYACMLGGPDGKTLFILTSDLARDGLVGRIETIRVEAPRAGFP
ncbi:MAG: SMP-30/gluconolactonase/LRE family protein [Desulfobacteraceae bacterium]|nr:SMP-30/gluconolactonase/LRE family protein [Desulfobacteraceae bacterium]